MSTEVKMPQLSDTMDAGKILVWNKKEGDKIARGDILAEVETDKANLEIESFHAGYLLKIVTPAGQSANVGQAIAVIGQEGESADTAGSANGNGSTANQTATAPAQPEAAAQNTTQEHIAPVSQNNPPTPFDSARVKASPLAKKLADKQNLDLSNLQGSGPNGRIVRKDIEQYSQSGKSTIENQASPSSTLSQANNAPERSSSSSHSSGELTGALTPLSKMRATIARRMQQAVSECPHFYTSMSVDMSSANQLRSAFKNDSNLKDISINHLIIKAAAYALKREPGVNSCLKDENIFTPEQVNIGVVTAIEGGLLIPVIKNVDSLNLKDLAFEARAAIERARAGRPSASDLNGGTFSISNMGMFGVENFTAIINPGQGAILAVGATLEQAVVKNGVMQIAPVMKVTLSVDHRIIDGTMAGNWLNYFKQSIEAPALLLI